jgi:hypothetical protein
VRQSVKMAKRHRQVSASRLAAGGRAGYSGGMTQSTPCRYRGHRFPPEIISHAVWLYLDHGKDLRLSEVCI